MRQDANYQEDYKEFKKEDGQKYLVFSYLEWQISNHLLLILLFNTFFLVLIDITLSNSGIFSDLLY